MLIRTAANGGYPAVGGKHKFGTPSPIDYVLLFNVSSYTCKMTYVKMSQWREQDFSGDTRPKQDKTECDQELFLINFLMLL